MTSTVSGEEWGDKKLGLQKGEGKRETRSGRRSDFNPRSNKNRDKEDLKEREREEEVTELKRANS